jgi:anaerobic selenocysteine-containing dehydrogenase
MVRKGFLASPDKPQGVRGQDEFVRVSWRTAVCSELANGVASAPREERTFSPSVSTSIGPQSRVRYPMVRKGFLASPDKPQGVRGQDEFVRVSWEQAVGAGKNRGRSVAFADPTMLGIDQIQRLLPAHPHKFANSLQTAVRDQVHSKTRVRYPMVRKGFLASPELERQP